MVFWVCFAFGGTIMILQFILTLVGLAGHGSGGDLGHDVGGDVHGGGVDVHGGAADGAHSTNGDAFHHGTNWLFSVVSFRTVVAAFCFFGLAGLIADSAEASAPVTISAAVGGGLTAMFGVYFLMRYFYSLKADGTVRIWSAVGRSATVYVPVPAHKSGSGKIQINLQNRTMEYLAMTAGEHLPTGARVVVTDVLTSDTLEVQGAPEPEGN
jgi:hypothetical protein